MGLDVLLASDKVYPRQPHTHGTGCCTSGLVQGWSSGLCVGSGGRMLGTRSLCMGDSELGIALGSM